MKYVVLISVLAQSLCGALSFAANEISLRTSIGLPCSDTSDCVGDNMHCIAGRETTKGAVFVGGYCVKFDCSATAPCDIGAKCVQAEGTDFNVCLAACTEDSHCRNGYACHEQVCLPE